MAPEGQGRAAETPALTSLPRVEDLPGAADGYDREKVREAFEAFRRHTTQLQVQLRVLQAAGQSGQVEPTGHAVRMDALHLIRAAAEMADTIERDAQTASASQIRKTEEEVARRQRDLQERQGDVDRYRQESEKQRAEMLNAAKSEARQMQQEAQQQATQEVTEAEARATRPLEWARAQAVTIISRAQEGAEQLLGAAGLGDESVGRVAQSIVTSAEAVAEASRGPAPSGPSPLREPEPVAEAADDDASDEPQAEAPPLSPPEPSSGSQSDDESTS
jgi:F0F1-type ATP synthase membrane subunit b/b'